MTDQEKIISFLRTTGPTIPSKVAKNIGSNLLLASAHLSELVGMSKVKVSHLKIGGSPLYYLPGQESQLYPFAAGNINPKDLQVLDRLKEVKVMRERDLDLLSKVALRSLKDFAVPLEVGFQGQIELFWKWHLLSSEETNELVKKFIEPVKEEVKPVVEEKIEAIREEPTPEAPKEEPTTPSPSSPPQKETIEEKRPVPKQKTLTDEKPRAKPKTRKKVIEDTFLPQLEKFFSKLEIHIEQKETLRKNAEMNFILKVPTAVGSMTYYCKAKQKKRCDEKDLSSAFMEAQMKKMPLLFLYTNELSKKAEEMLESGAFENITVRKVN